MPDTAIDVKTIAVADYAYKVRSKNAGPYWVTIDLFCADQSSFDLLQQALSIDKIAQLYQQNSEAIKRFVLPELKVIKISFARPVVQGSRFDRDMHGAQYAVLLEEMVIDV